MLKRFGIVLVALYCNLALSDDYSWVDQLEVGTNFAIVELNIALNRNVLNKISEMYNLGAEALDRPSPNTPAAYRYKIVTLQQWRALSRGGVRHIRFIKFGHDENTTKLRQRYKLDLEKGKLTIEILNAFEPYYQDSSHPVFILVTKSKLSPNLLQMDLAGEKVNKVDGGLEIKINNRRNLSYLLEGIKAGTFEIDPEYVEEKKDSVCLGVLTDSSETSAKAIENSTNPASSEPQ